MVDFCTKIEAEKYLQALVGLHLSYVRKAYDFDMFEFCFEQKHSVFLQTAPNNTASREKLTLILHAICELKVIWPNKRTNVYNAETPLKQFYTNINQLLSLSVKRIALSDKNDLWIDLGVCWIVFITFESNEESWRFFTTEKKHPHLVASDLWLQTVYST